MSVSFALCQGRDCLLRPAGVVGIVLAMKQLESVIIRESQPHVGIRAVQARGIGIVPPTELALNLNSMAGESINLRIG